MNTSIRKQVFRHILPLIYRIWWLNVAHIKCRPSSKFAIASEFPLPDILSVSYFKQIANKFQSFLDVHSNYIFCHWKFQIVSFLPEYWKEYLFLTEFFSFMVKRFCQSCEMCSTLCRSCTTACCVQNENTKT